MKILMKNINGREENSVCFFDGSQISLKDQRYKFVTDAGDPVSESQARKRGFVLDPSFEHPKFKLKTEVSDYLRGTLKLNPVHPDYGRLYAQLSDKLDTANTKVEHPGARPVQFGRMVNEPEPEPKVEYTYWEGKPGKVRVKTTFHPDGSKTEKFFPDDWTGSY